MGEGGRGYTSLNRPYEVLIMGNTAPYPPKGPCEFRELGFRGSWPWAS